MNLSEQEIRTVVYEDEVYVHKDDLISYLNVVKGNMIKRDMLKNKQAILTITAIQDEVLAKIEIQHE